jgi:WD40 repeat protein
VRFLRRLTTAGVLGLSFDDAGVLVGNLDTGDLLVWDLSATGASEWLTVASGTDAANGVAVGHDGRLLAAGEGDEYRIVDAATGEDLVVVEPGPELISHHGLDTDPADYRVVDAAFSPPDDSLLATAVDHAAGGGGAVMVWDTATGDLIEVLGDPAHSRGGFSVSFSPDGSLLAASLNNAVVVWDTTTYQAIPIAEPTAAVWWPAVAFSPDGTRIAARAEGIAESLADFGSHTAIFDLDGNQTMRVELDPPRAGASVVAFSTDGTTLLVNGRLAGGAYDVSLWDPGTGELISTLGPVEGLVAAASFGPEGSRVAVGDQSAVRVFDTETGTVLFTLPALNDDSLVTDLAFGPEGTRLAAAVHGEGVLRVFAIDVDDLAGIAIERLTRSFTDTECRIYAIDPCPTLAEMRAPAE